MASLEQLAHQNTQPNLDLVHPGCMLGCVVKNYRMCRIMQKGGPTFHGLQDPALAFDPQRLQRNPLTFSYPAHQRFRLMDVEVIQDDVPFRGRRIAGNQALKVGKGILLSAGGTPGRCDDLSSHDIEIDEPG